MASRLQEFAELVHDELGDATVVAKHDRVALQQHQQRRRIVWLTEGGQTIPPAQRGATFSIDGVGQRIQICRMRVEHVDAHLFAEDRETTEHLLDNVIAAVCNVLKVVEIPSYTWESEDNAEAGRALRGAHCVLRINLHLFVPQEIKPLRLITGVEDVCGTLDDDGEVVPQE